MRVFKYWSLAKSTAVIDGEEKSISCFGGSNHSENDALDDGSRRLEIVKRRIAGFDKKKGPEYEADILEEPLKWFGDRDVITRNRYGAEVLNSTSSIFVDIDEPAFSIWQIFKPARTREQRKQKILDFLDKRLQKPDLAGFCIRVYETHSGIRLILEGKTVEPKSPELEKMMRSFNADRLYTALCKRQNCYRARLTPKPHRIKMKPIRLRYPYEEKNRNQIDAWVKQYNFMSERFSTCKLVKVVNSGSPSQAVRYHDERTKAQSNLPLA